MSAPLSTVVSEVARSQDPAGTVAIVMRDHMAAETAMSLWMTHWPTEVDRIFVRGSILTLQRNQAIAMMRGDWLLFIDDDMVWAPDAVVRLLAARDELLEQGQEPDVVGGLCFRRTSPYHPTLYVREGPTRGRYAILERWEDGLVEVDATGMAFALITKRCLERIAGIEMPPFKVRQDAATHANFFRWEGGLGEDLRFCQDVKATGGHIFVDTRIEIGHIGEIEVRSRHFLEQMAKRSPFDLTIARQFNEEHGLPTLEPDEALRQLRVGS